MCALEGTELMADQMLIGFDAREVGEYDPSWKDVRRQRFLLRRDVARPLSVDAAVWPTIVDGPWRHVPVLDGPGGKQIGDQVTRDYDRTVIGPNAPLWENLDRMKIKLGEQGIDPADMVLVAVGWLSRHGFRDTDNMGGYVGTRPDPVPTEPAQPAKNWTLLGYDVADFPLSGLSDCGYTPEDSDRWRDTWAPKLNEHHLFRDPETAFAFLQVTNMRVPEHAPFHVYSLYRLP
jgi:hypothetical protein